MLHIQPDQHGEYSTNIGAQSEKEQLPMSGRGKGVKLKNRPIFPVSEMISDFPEI